MCNDRDMHAAKELSEFTEIALRIEGMDVRVFESDVAAGPAFVLIHGFGVSSRYFGPLARELSRHGRVVVLDLPGFGYTRDPGRALRIGGFARVVNAVIHDRAVPNPVLVGHSMGTQVAVEAMVQEPGLSSALLLAAPVVNDAERHGPLLMWRFIQSGIKEPPASAWDSIRGFLRSGPRWLLLDFRPMLEYHIEERLGLIDAPVTVIGGVGDRIAPPAWCQRLATTRPGSAVVIVDGAAHQMIHTNAPEVARAAMELARTKPGLPLCGD